MKVNDIDKLRSQVYKSLKCVYFDDCEIHEFERVEFDRDRLNPENVGTHEIRTLYNPMGFYRYHRDEKWKSVYECKLYLTLDDDWYHIYVENKEKRCFDIVRFDDYDCYENRTVFMMELAVKIARYLDRYGIGGAWHMECYE